MDLYTLDTNFMKSQAVDIFNSLIWTERYSDAGDFSLIVPSTPKMVNLLSLGTYLGLDDSEETMIIDTQSINNNLLTVTGKSLINFLDQRVYRPSYYQYTTSTVYNSPISAVIVALVQWACSPVTDPPSVGLSFNDRIANLGFINQDPSNDPAELDVSAGPVFSLIQQIASTYSKGISLVAINRSESGFALQFKAYIGSDRTSDQATYPLVQFSPDTKTLTDTTELYSSTTFKNVCYAYASSMPQTVSLPDGTVDSDGNPNMVDTPINPRMGYAALDAAADASTGFARRLLLVDDGDFSIDNYAVTNIATMEAQIAATLDTYAKNQLANNTYTKNVDGTVVPQSQYQYGRDYFLGDVIELEGASGIIQKARITEYIRSEDTTGELAYPTVAVID